MNTKDQALQVVARLLQVHEGRAPDEALKIASAMLEQEPVQPADAQKLLQIIAALYQIAGVYEAPDHVLDVLANPTSATQDQIDALLPFVPADPVELSDDTKLLDFLSDCVMNHRVISAERDRDAVVDSPTFGDLPTVTLFTVPSQHVRGLGLRDAIIAAINAKGAA